MGVIRDDDKNRHVITSFVFRELDKKDVVQEDDGFTPMFHQQHAQPEEKPVTPPPTTIEPIIPQPHIVEHREEIEKRDKMIESLLEKTDLLSQELIKVQAKLTNQESLFRDEMTRAKDEAFHRGVQEGLTQAKLGHEAEYREKIHQLEDSIKKLETLSVQFESMIKNLEKELIHTSIAIAKEVIDSEIAYNSGQVAINLAKSLISKLEEASEIELRVNMQDYESVKVGLSDLQHVKIVPDSAVTRGGVIVTSDVGSIEGNIMERYKKIKDDIFSKI